MKTYLITFDESDGNDCTVYEAIIPAENPDMALMILADSVEAAMRSNDTVYETDGSEFGYYFGCPDDCDTLQSLDACDSMEPCGIHAGGISLRTVETFDAYDAARAARSKFHLEWHV
jgi:hypothetical protein